MNTSEPNAGAQIEKFVLNRLIVSFITVQCLRIRVVQNSSSNNMKRSLMLLMQIPSQEERSPVGWDVFYVLKLNFFYLNSAFAMFDERRSR